MRLLFQLQDFVDDYKNSVKQIVLICEKICDISLLHIKRGVVYEIDAIRTIFFTSLEKSVHEINDYYQEILKYLMIIFEGFQNEIPAVRFS